MLSNLRKKTLGSKPSDAGPNLEQGESNPMYSEGHERRVTIMDFGTPKWFSPRYGPHMANDVDVLFDSPVYGLQVAPAMQEGWVHVSSNMMMGSPLFSPQPSVYQSKYKIPPWFLFHTSPEVEGKVEKGVDGNYYLTAKSSELCRAISHFQKEIRDPSLGLLKATFTSSLHVALKLESAQRGRDDSQSPFGAMVVKVKFNPWYRTQLKTHDLMM